MSVQWLWDAAEFDFVFQICLTFWIFWACALSWFWKDYYTNIGAFGFITSFFPSFYIGVQNPRWLFLYFFWKVEARNVVTGRFCWHLDEQKLILLKSTTTFNLSLFSINFILVVGKVPILLLAHYNVYWNKKTVVTNLAICKRVKGTFFKKKICPVAHFRFYPLHVPPLRMWPCVRTLLLFAVVLCVVYVQRNGSSFGVHSISQWCPRPLWLFRLLTLFVLCCRRLVFLPCRL